MSTQSNAWLPASTGLPSDREPTRQERWEAWKRQAEGVHDMTRRSRFPLAQAQRSAWVFVAIQALVALGFLAGLVLLPPAAHAGLVMTLHVVAMALALLAQVAGPAVIAADVVAEVTAKSAQAWSSSPLATSAWVAGKTAFYLSAQVLATLRVLPVLAASAMLGGITLRQVILITCVGSAWTLVAGVAAAASSLEPRVSLTGRMSTRGLFASRAGVNPALRGGPPPGAALAIMQITLGFAGSFIALPFLLSGQQISSAPVPVRILVSVLAALSPLAAGLSALLPLRVPMFGLDVPLWAVSLLVACAVAPMAIAIARLKWRAPDGSLGYGVRPTSLIAWLTLSLMLVGLCWGSPHALRVACLVTLPLAAVTATMASGATRLPDLGAGRVTGWRRAAALDRSTAEAHGMVVLAMLSALFGLLMPGGTFALTSPAAALLVAVASAPLVLVAGAVGRETRRSVARVEAGVKESVQRPASIVFALLLGGSFAPLFAVMADTSGHVAAGGFIRLAGLLGPVGTMVELAEQALGVAIPGFAWLPAIPGALVIAMALQWIVAVLAWKLEKRAAAKDDFVAAPSMTE